MILLTNGDSWTQGDSPAQTINWEAQNTLDWYRVYEDFGFPHQEKTLRVLNKFYDSPVWPKELGRRLGVKTYNAGRLGTDNYSIMYRTINAVEGLLKKGYKDIKVVIGWSSMLRIPIFTKELTDKGYMIHLNQARPWPKTFAIKNMYAKNEHYEDLFVLTVSSLQNYLDSKNIDYRFFNAFDEFKDFETNVFKNLLNKNKWIDKNVSKAHFREYIIDKYNLKSDLSDNETYFTAGHPTDISHIEWAEHLYNILKDEWS